MVVTRLLAVTTVNLKQHMVALLCSTYSELRSFQPYSHPWSGKSFPLPVVVQRELHGALHNNTKITLLDTVHFYFTESYNHYSWKRPLWSCTVTIVQSLATMTTTPRPSVPHLHVSWKPSETVILPHPWTAYSNASPLFLRRNLSWYPIWTFPSTI